MEAVEVLKHVKRAFASTLGDFFYYDIGALQELGLAKDVDKMPVSLKILLENVLRGLESGVATLDDVRAVGGVSARGREIPFMPARVLLQDFTGIPLIVDLAAMRDLFKELGEDPAKINPQIPSHLVVDHSIQVDYFLSSDAYLKNLELEFSRNRERYSLLKWASAAFKNFSVIPPGRGIVHQVNLERLASVVEFRMSNGWRLAFPDSVLGTDSHTPMVNGLGVVGWGVGGIEAEAMMLGQPYYMPLPEVVGVRLVGELQAPALATDLALTVTELLRKKNVVGKFVEFFGAGLKSLTVTDRATVANMAPEYGATVGLFPIDEQTLQYLALTGRPPDHVKSVKEYTILQGLFVEDHEAYTPSYAEVVELDLTDVEPSIAGPTNPEDRIRLREAKERLLRLMKVKTPTTRSVGAGRAGDWEAEGGPGWVNKAPGSIPLTIDGELIDITDGAVVIAAITSCTNTSNAAAMISAGLLARNARLRGLKRRPYVKTSMAPGSAVVHDYLEEAGLMPYLSELGFHIVGYGCTTCIGNSGPLIPEVEEAIKKYDLHTVAVLSGNRNFEGRIHPLVKGSFLASPALVVAYAIAGRIDIDFYSEPLGTSPDGHQVYLMDIWPKEGEVLRIIQEKIRPEMFIQRYTDIYSGVGGWDELAPKHTQTYEWDPNSTYIRRPPFFEDFQREPAAVGDIRGARVLLLLGDRVTTDHISPAGAIPPTSPAGKYLRGLGVDPVEFNTYGARRGNHEVMIRGAFSNPRLRNFLPEDGEGGWTIHQPGGAKMTVYEAAMRYKAEGTPLIVIAGKQYGAGSSRDWAAKGTYLLGVKAVIAESFERIHKSNLIGMGVLPLQFEEGQGWRTLGLTGREIYEIEMDEPKPGKRITVRAHREDGTTITFKALARLDTPMEVEYYKHGGILPYVARRLLSR
jgi:aconitate hydratase